MIEDSNIEPGEIDPEELRRHLADREIPITPNVVNHDDDWPFDDCIGHVYEVNGAGTEEVKEFIPTRHELEQVFSYWAKRKMDLDFLMFVYNQVGSDWLRISSFASRRLNRIERLLGADACQPLCEAVEARFAKNSGDLWRAFKEGDTVTRDRLLEDFYRELDRRDD